MRRYDTIAVCSPKAKLGNYRIGIHEPMAGESTSTIFSPFFRHSLQRSIHTVSASSKSRATLEGSSPRLSGERCLGRQWPPNLKQAYSVLVSYIANIAPEQGPKLQGLHLSGALVMASSTRAQDNSSVLSGRESFRATSMPLALKR
jgi:hypothetical protein